MQGVKTEFILQNSLGSVPIVVNHQRSAWLFYIFMEIK